MQSPTKAETTNSTDQEMEVNVVDIGEEMEVTTTAAAVKRTTARMTTGVKRTTARMSTGGKAPRMKTTKAAPAPKKVPVPKGSTRGAVKKPKGSPKTARAVKSAPTFDHPTYTEMVTKALGELKERSGSTRQAIVKYIKNNFDVPETKHFNVAMNNALNKGVDEGTIVQLVSAGAAPRWRLPPKSASKESLSGKRSTAKQQDKPNKTTVVTPRRGLKVLADKLKTSGSRTTKATPPKKTIAKKTVEKKAKPAMPKKKSPKTAKAKASPKVAAASPMVRATRARSAVKAPAKGKEEVPAKEEKAKTPVVRGKRAAPKPAAKGTKKTK